MTPSESARRLRERIEQAIDDHQLTRAELDEIMHIATEDGYEDPHEQSLLNQLQQMIENRDIRVIP